MASLPSHRQFLTCLLDSLSKNPSYAEEASPSLGHQAIPLNRRRLLLTLHVLFPTLLLPALDLLDRSLATEFILDYASPGQGGQRQDGVYLVKSLASTMSRHGRKRPSAKRYIVHLSAWNCTCASFALDAFPPTIRSPTLDAAGDRKDATSAFGGLSMDGHKDIVEGVPCCKHLLACLLVDRWRDVMGSYVEDAKVTTEELAGIIAGI